MSDDVPRARDPEERLKQCNVRMPRALLEQVDEEVRLANEAAGWEKVTQSDVLRDLVAEALDARKRGRKMK